MDVLLNFINWLCVVFGFAFYVGLLALKSNFPGLNQKKLLLCSCFLSCGRYDGIICSICFMSHVDIFSILLWTFLWSFAGTQKSLFWQKITSQEFYLRYTKNNAYKRVSPLFGFSLFVLLQFLEAFEFSANGEARADNERYVYCVGVI